MSNSKYYTFKEALQMQRLRTNLDRYKRYVRELEKKQHEQDLKVAERACKDLLGLGVGDTVCWKRRVGYAPNTREINSSGELVGVNLGWEDILVLSVRHGHNRDQIRVRSDGKADGLHYDVHKQTPTDKVRKPYGPHRSKEPTVVLLSIQPQNQQVVISTKPKPKS